MRSYVLVLNLSLTAISRSHTVIESYNGQGFTVRHITGMSCWWNNTYMRKKQDMPFEFLIAIVNKVLSPVRLFNVVTLSIWKLTDVAGYGEVSR